jgi:hypothetical protein
MLTLLPALTPGAALAKKQKPGYVVVLSTTLGAEILVDGQVVGTVPFEEPIALTAGSHEVEVRRRGFSTFAMDVEVAAGKTQELEIDLIAIEGIVRITTPEIVDATILVDSRIIGSTPFDGLIPAGDHMIRVEKDGFLPAERPLSVRAGDEYDVAIEMKTAPRPVTTTTPRPGTLGSVDTTRPPALEDEDPEFYETWWFWTLTGAVVAGAAVGVALAVAPQDEKLVPASFDAAATLPAFGP